MSNKAPSSSSAAVVTACLVIVAALYLARDVLIPLALAVLLSFVLAPGVVRLRRIGLGRVPAVITVVVLAFALILGIGGLVTAQAAELVGNIRDYRHNIITKVHALRASLMPVASDAASVVEQIQRELTSQPATQAAPADSEAGPAEPGPVLNGAELRGEPEADTDAAPAATQPIAVQIVPPRGELAAVIRWFLPALSPLGTAAIAIVLVIFILLQQEDLRDRIIRLFGSGHLYTTTEALGEAASAVSRYLLLQLLVNGIHGAVVGLGLMVIGVPGALLFGLLSMLLRFIPYVGPWIAAVLPIGLSLAVFDGWTRPLMVLGLFAVIELLSNNLLEPLLYGTRTGASPLAIIVSALFWTWLWGGVGLVLATPITVCLVVVGRFVPQLEFLAVLLGDQPALSPAVRLYQRLLALDRAGAEEIAEESRAGRALVELYDCVFIPALSQMERDRHRGTLDAGRATFIRRALLELIADQGAAEQRARAGGDGGRPATASTRLAADTAPVLCAAARDEADEVVAQMLAQILMLDGVPARVASAALLAGELVEQVRQAPPSLVCISALPPSTIAHARYLYKRLGEADPGLQVVVGLWGTAPDRRETAAQIAQGPRVEVVGSLAEAAALARGRVQAGIQREPVPD